MASLLWMTASLMSFIGMAIGTRELSFDLSVFQIQFFRSLFGLFILTPFLFLRYHEILRVRKLHLHGVRNTVHFFAQYCWSVGVVLLPLAEVFALEFTMPIWVAIFAYIFLGEKIPHERKLAIIGGFVGVLIIVRPGVAVVDAASFIVLLSAVGYALSIIIVKYLTSSCTPFALIFWMVVFQLPIGFILALQDWRTPSLDNLPWMILIGLAGLTAHFAMAKAFKYLDASIAIPVDFFRVPLIAIIGYYLYNEQIEVWLVIGAIVIFASNYYGLRKASKN